MNNNILLSVLFLTSIISLNHLNAVPVAQFRHSNLKVEITLDIGDTYKSCNMGSVISAQILTKDNKITIHEMKDSDIAIPGNNQYVKNSRSQRMEFTTTKNQRISIEIQWETSKQERKLTIGTW